MASNGNNGHTKPLPADKEAFCRLMAFESSTDLNQSEVYAQTHKVTKMNHKTICEMASRLMADRKIMARISELRRPVMERFQAYHAAWLCRLRDMAFFDVRKLFDSHGRPIEIPELSDDVAPAVAGYEVHEKFSGKGEDRVAVGCTKKYRLANRLEALVELGKALGWYPDKTKTGFRGQLDQQGEGQSMAVEFVDAK